MLTQDTADLLGSDLGQAVVANAATQILLRQAPQTIDALGEAFRLSEGEKQFLLAAPADKDCSPPAPTGSPSPPSRAPPSTPWSPPTPPSSPTSPTSTRPRAPTPCRSRHADHRHPEGNS